MKRSLLVLCSALAILGSVPAANACMTPTCPWWSPDCEIIIDAGLAPGGETSVTFLSPTKALIEVGPYVTPQMDINYNCVVALGPVDGIQAVDRISLVDRTTRRRLPGYSWQDNVAALGDFAQLSAQQAAMDMPANEWQGFFTSVPGSRGGIVHSFQLAVTLEPGTTPQKLLRNLRQQGLLANGAAFADGTLNTTAPMGHYHLRRVADGEVRLIFPAPGKAPGLPTLPRK